MNPLLVRFVLGFANVPSKDVDDLEKQLPGIGRMVAAAKDIKPDLEACGPHLEAMLPHIEALMPIAERVVPKIKAAWPDLVAVLPVLQEFAAIAQR